MTQCPNCGAVQRRPDARFCQNCGAPLRPTSAATQSSTVTSKRSWQWLAGAVLALLLLGGVAIIALGPGRDILVNLLHRNEVSSNPTPLPTQLPTSIPATSPASPTRTPTAPPATMTATNESPTSVPATATPLSTATTVPNAPTNSAEEQIRALLREYRDIKVESLTHWDTHRLDDVLADPILERQKRGICGLRNAGQYFQYDNREFHILNISFQDDYHATVLARIRENRVLRDRSGDVITDYGHEDYRAVFLLKREANGHWKIYCFHALEDNEPISCKITIPQKNPCNQ